MTFLLRSTRKLLLQCYREHTVPLYRKTLARYYWKVMKIGGAFFLFDGFAVFTRRVPGGRSRA
jgi:hypothetical protein